VVPTTPMHPTIAQVEEEPVRWNSLLGSYTNFVNLLGWSALAVPASLVPGEGGGGERPFGVTLIAPGGYDTALVALGATWQASVGRQLPFGAPSAGLRRVAVELPEAGCVPASEPVLRLAAVGAHLTGMPLHYQMQERRAKLLETTTTVPAYRLYALKGTTPAKPGLVRVGDGGCAIEVQVYAMPQAAVGSLLALIPSPLGLGTVELADGRKVHSFICEPYGIEGATDVSEIGGWRAYIQSLGKR
jgi:allophanate hydrolase